MRKLWNSPHPYAMFTILLWSLGYVWTKAAMEQFSPVSIGFLRYIVASVTLAALAAAYRTGLPRREELPWLLLSGAVGFFLYMIAYNIGQEVTTVATASLVIATVPVMTALLARAVYGERLRPLQWGAIGVEFAGVALLTAVSGVMAGNWGVLWLVAAAAGELIQSPPGPAVCILLLGVFTSGLAYAAWSKAFEKAEKTSQVSNYMFVTPLLTSVLGAAVLGEVPGPATLAGGGVILAGVVLFQLGGGHREAAGGEGRSAARAG